MGGLRHSNEVGPKLLRGGPGSCDSGPWPFKGGSLMDFKLVSVR